MTQREDRWARLVNALARQRVIRRQVFLEQFKRHELRKMQSIVGVELLQRLRDELDNRLRSVQRGRFLSATETARREALLRKLGDIATAGIRETARRNLQGLVDVGILERDAMAGMYDGGLVRGVHIELEVPSVSTIRQLAKRSPFKGMPLDEHWERVGRSVKSAIQTSVGEGLVRGDGYETIARRARLQTTQLAKRHVETMARTSVHHVQHQVRVETFRNAGSKNAPLVVAEEHVSTLDSRTSDECRELDGRFFEVGEGPVPPVHPNCRSTRAPIIRKLSARSIPEGEPPPIKKELGEKDPNYNTWLKKQDAETQNEVLGSAEKGKAFRRGKLHVRDFQDAQGNPRSIDEVRKLEERPWQNRVIGRGELPGELTQSEVRRRVQGR